MVGDGDIDIVIIERIAIERIVGCQITYFPTIFTVNAWECGIVNRYKYCRRIDERSIFRNGRGVACFVGDGRFDPPVACGCRDVGSCYGNRRIAICDVLCGDSIVLIDHTIAVFVEVDHITCDDTRRDEDRHIHTAVVLRTIDDAVTILDRYGRGIGHSGIDGNAQLWRWCRGVVEIIGECIGDVVHPITKCRRWCDACDAYSRTAVGGDECVGTWVIAVELGYSVSFATVDVDSWSVVISKVVIVLHPCIGSGVEIRQHNDRWNDIGNESEGIAVTEVIGDHPLTTSYICHRYRRTAVDGDVECTVEIRDIGIRIIHIYLQIDTADTVDLLDKPLSVGTSIPLWCIGGVPLDISVVIGDEKVLPICQRSMRAVWRGKVGIGREDEDPRFVGRGRDLLIESCTAILTDGEDVVFVSCRCRPYLSRIAIIVLGVIGIAGDTILDHQVGGDLSLVGNGMICVIHYNLGDLTIEGCIATTNHCLYRGVGVSITIIVFPLIVDIDRLFVLATCIIDQKCDRCFTCTKGCCGSDTVGSRVASDIVVDTSIGIGVVHLQSVRSVHTEVEYRRVLTLIFDRDDKDVMIVHISIDRSFGEVLQYIIDTIEVDGGVEVDRVFSIDRLFGHIALGQIGLIGGGIVPERDSIAVCCHRDTRIGLYPVDKPLIHTTRHTLWLFHKGKGVTIVKVILNTPLPITSIGHLMRGIIGNVVEIELTWKGGNVSIGVIDINLQIDRACTTLLLYFPLACDTLIACRCIGTAPAINRTVIIRHHQRLEIRCDIGVLFVGAGEVGVGRECQEHTTVDRSGDTLMES